MGEVHRIDDRQADAGRDARNEINRFALPISIGLLSLACTGLLGLSGLYLNGIADTLKLTNGVVSHISDQMATMNTNLAVAINRIDNNSREIDRLQGRVR